MRLLAEDLACVRGGRRLFQGLGFAVADGEALLVTGPNGAGKTSLLRLIAGLLRPAGGRIALEGVDAEKTIGSLVHFVGHLPGVNGALSAEENLAFQRTLFGGGGGVTAALTRLGLDRLADFPARMLSSGQQRRLALARLVVAPRPIWLLDEPMSGLDMEGQETLTLLAAAHRAGGGLLIVATHVPLPFSQTREIRLAGEVRP
jgi:heme exporter protein A